MKFLLLAAAVLGVVYMVFIESKKTPNDDDRPEVIYQREVDKARELEDFLQQTVDQRGEQMDDQGQ